MIVLGLTGSIGMGKSTTAQLFAEAGVPVYDADAAVHRLYEGEAAPAIEAAFPGTTVDGKVDRVRLSARVVHDPAAMKRAIGDRNRLIAGRLAGQEDASTRRGARATPQGRIRASESASPGRTPP